MKKDNGRAGEGSIFRQLDRIETVCTERGR